jgi:HEAT repeat protein
MASGHGPEEESPAPAAVSPQIAGPEPVTPGAVGPGAVSNVPKLAVGDLLHAAAMGRAGVDRALIRSILEFGDAALPEVLAFARAPRENRRMEIDPLLVDLVHHFQVSAASPHADEALAFLINAIRRSRDDVGDELIQALLPFGEKAMSPLLDLYAEFGEEQSSDVAFLLAGLRLRDPKVLAVLLDRLEFDAADGAFLLGLYGDPAARPALEKILAEIPEEDVELRREIRHALEQLEAPEPKYQPEPFDILAEYPERELPEFDVIPEAERIEMLGSPDAIIRAGAAYSFFNAELSPKARVALLEAATSDSDPAVRGRAWESLADAVQDASIRDALIAVLNDSSKSVEERGGAAVGLHLVADRDDVRKGIEALYELNGKARAKALEAMWRSLWPPYAEYFPPNLDDTRPEILRPALRGAGYFQLTRCADKIAKFFDREEPYSKLREDALFAYALAMPGETTRGRVRGMLRKLDGLAGLTSYEAELVEFALDERLRLNGLDPVFAAEQEIEDGSPEQPPAPVAAAPQQKIGRNDPCPCGSGKKYKKCCGAG